MFSFTSVGDWGKTEKYLNALLKLDIMGVLHSAGEKGVAALQTNTPIESGLAASSWRYKVKKTSNGYELTWYNSNIENGFPVAIMLQLGYATGTGGYVHGVDYINPAVRPIFDEIADRVSKAVRTL